VAQLKWHGIEAQLQFSATESASAAEKIKEIAYSVDADLIVMGAYGHNRMRELFFGGATRDLLIGCETAVLMMH